jgi:recombination protein RecT
MANDLILKSVHSNLNTLLESKADALPQDFNKTRFLQNSITVLQDTKGIEKCNALSVARTMLKGAFLGLDFLNKECYAIPYGNSLQFQTDYKGEIKLAKKYSINPIKDIYAKLVRENDEFVEEIKDGQQIISFKPMAFNDGEIIGAFAVCYYQDGSMIYETMSKAEIEKTRKDYSKMPNGTSWVKSTGEMYKKTVLRRLCKNISLDFDNIEQKKAFDDGGDSEVKETKSKAKNILTEKEVEDVEYSIVDEVNPELDDDLPDCLKEESENE